MTILLKKSISHFKHSSVDRRLWTVDLSFTKKYEFYPLSI
jgi:hypothetical protein